MKDKTMIETTRGSLTVDNGALIFLRGNAKDVVFPGKPGWSVTQYAIKENTVMMKLDDFASSFSLLVVHNIGEKSYLYIPSTNWVKLQRHQDFFYILVRGQVRRSTDGVIWEIVANDVEDLQTVPDGIVFLHGNHVVVNGRKIDGTGNVLLVTPKATVVRAVGSNELSVIADDKKFRLNTVFEGLYNNVHRGVVGLNKVLVIMECNYFAVSHDEGLTWLTFRTTLPNRSATILDGKLFVLKTSGDLICTEDFITWDTFSAPGIDCYGIAINYNGDLVWDWHAPQEREVLYRPRWSVKKYGEQIPCKREKDRQILLSLRRLRCNFVVFLEVMSH